MCYISPLFHCLEAEVTHQVVQSLLCVVTIVSKLVNHSQVFFDRSRECHNGDSIATVDFFYLTDELFMDHHGVTRGPRTTK